MSSEHLIVEEEGDTLIIVRRTPTVAKRAFAGVMLEIFSARFMASMAAFSKETAFSRPFGRWDSVTMVETEGSYEEGVRAAAVGKNQNPITAMEMGDHPAIICRACRKRVGCCGHPRLSTRILVFPCASRS